MSLADNDLTAYFSVASRKLPASVSIYRHEAGRNRFVTVIAVEDKREARKVAQQMNAQPYNF